LHLKQYGIDKENTQLILSILSKLDIDYSFFVSTFYATMDALGKTFTMPSLDEYSTSLTMEQAKLVHMGTLKSPRPQALLVDQGTSPSKGKK